VCPTRNQKKFLPLQNAARGVSKRRSVLFKHFSFRTYVVALCYRKLAALAPLVASANLCCNSLAKPK
jgi:hypothetical protein